MGKNHVRFRCHSCGHCCKDVICLPTPWDVIRIVRATKIPPLKFIEFITPEEITEVEKSDAAWLDADGDKYMMALRRKKKGCHFLDKKTGYCAIYEDRPLLCRLYPFKLQETKSGKFKGFGLHKDVGCPRNRDGKVEVKQLHDLHLDDERHQRDYHDLVAVFNRREYKGKKAKHFLDMFVRIKTVPKQGKKKG